jgi:hypothetical protein
MFVEYDNKYYILYSSIHGLFMATDYMYKFIGTPSADCFSTKMT